MKVKFTNFRFRQEIILVGLCLIQFLPASWTPYLQDDWYLVQPTTWNNIGISFFNNWVHDFPDYPNAPQAYRPLVRVYSALLFKAFGFQFFWSHLFSILLFSGICIQILRCFKKLGLDHAFEASLLFTVSPIHHESVVWLTGISDLLAALFLLTAFLSYIRRGKAFILWCILAMLSKEWAFLFPILFIFYDLLISKEKSLRRWFVLIGFASGVFLFRLLALGGWGGYIHRIPRDAMDVLLHNIHNPACLFFPFSQATDRPDQLWSIAMSIWFVVCLIGLIFWFRPKHLGRFLGLWTIFFLLPYVTYRIGIGGNGWGVNWRHLFFSSIAFYALCSALPKKLILLTISLFFFLSNFHCLDWAIAGKKSLEYLDGLARQNLNQDTIVVRGNPPSDFNGAPIFSGGIGLEPALQWYTGNRNLKVIVQR